MSPTLKDGDVKLFVKKRPKENDIVLAEHNNIEVVKRLKYGKLVGDNKNSAHNIAGDYKIVGVLWPKKLL